MIEEVRRELESSVDLDYKKFHQGLVPGLSSMIGVGKLTREEHLLLLKRKEN